MNHAIPPPPRTPSIVPTTGKVIGFGAIVVALANAPAFVALVTPRPEPPPAATRADVETLRADVKSVAASVNDLRAYLREKHTADETHNRKVNRALDRLAGPNEVATTETDYPLPP